MRSTSERRSLPNGWASPHVAFIVLLAGGLIRPELVGKTLDVLRREHGLPPDPQLAMLHPYLALFPAPAVYRSPADPLPPTTRYVRPAVLDEPVTNRSTQQMAQVARWLDQRPGRPVVYFTLGTIFHQESGDLFSRVIAGLCTLDAVIVVTVGREVDPAEVGVWPENVHVARHPASVVVAPMRVGGLARRFGQRDRRARIRGAVADLADGS